MSIIARQREIVDRRVLGEALASLASLPGTAAGDRSAVVGLLKTALRDGHDEIQRRFAGGASGAQTVREHCFLMDQLVRALHDFTIGHVYPLANPTSGEHLVIVAVGGYGRGELAPHSDIDLLFLLPYKMTPHAEQVIEYVLYTLWDIGLKVGQAARSLEECLRQARADMTIRTAMLEARYIWGDEKIFDDLKRRFETEIVKDSAGAFVEAKLTERKARHRRLGDSRYHVEPNVKEGKGGLRDLHGLFWIAKYIYRIDDVGKLVELGVLSEEESGRFARAQNFLWTVRCHLHYLTGRAEERLTFDVQTEIGRRMGYTDHAGTRGVERFMKHYFLVAKDVGDLTRIFCAVLEAEQEKKPRFHWKNFAFRRKTVAGFAVDAGRLTVAKDSAFKDDPVNFIRLFHAAQLHDLDIHPKALRLITQNLRLITPALREDPEANRLFLDILTSRKEPEIALRRMNEAGVFGRFVPDFGRVVAQMQYDMYHTHTVDEHTLIAIGILSRIESGALKDEHPLCTAVVSSVASRRVLYLALLLHDIAKGRGGDHSLLGEDIAFKLGPRLGLSAEETEQVAWLVRWHLLMSNTAFKRDITTRRRSRILSSRCSRQSGLSCFSSSPSPTSEQSDRRPGMAGKRRCCANCTVGQSTSCRAVSSPKRAIAELPRHSRRCVNSFLTSAARNSPPSQRAAIPSIGYPSMRQPMSGTPISCARRSGAEHHSPSRSASTLSAPSPKSRSIPPITPDFSRGLPVRSPCQGRISLMRAS